MTRPVSTYSEVGAVANQSIPGYGQRILTLLAQGKASEARRFIARAHAQRKCWAVLLPRIVESGFVPGLDTVDGLIPD